MHGRFLTFCAGILFCLVLLTGAAALGLPMLPHWLVVDQHPNRVGAIVVLGGGGGSRLRHAVELYDRRIAGLLILVGQEENDWRHIQRSCRECDLEHRRHVILNGSRNTMTDAELVLDFLGGKSIRSLLVVTDPYHTRRADLTFRKTFKGSGISLETVSTDDFGTLSRPGDRWWEDRRTLETVWMEFGKCLYLLAGGLVTGDW